jgi:two-component system chemotaxis response regulator CheY
MEIIRSSPEHHLVGVVERLKDEPQAWVGLHYAWSNKLDHDAMLKNPQSIGKALADLQQESGAFLNDLNERLQALKLDGYLYHFSDGDVLLLAKPDHSDNVARLHAVHQDRAKNLHASMSDFFQPNETLYKCRKLSERKQLLGKLMKAYLLMADDNSVTTLHARRRARNEPLVLLVEDDRFTASYTSNLLNAQYDMIHAKTAEEAMALYVEHAPDLVLMDIHLPGLSGQQALTAIKKIDSEAQIIMLSVDAAETSIMGAKENGAAGFLRKPYSKDRLIQTVRLSPLVRRCGYNSTPSPVTMIQ